MLRVHDAQPLRKSPAIVGTYRLLRQDIAERTGGFYGASEFDVGSLVERHRDLTGSPRAAWILENWAEAQGRFIKVGACERAGEQDKGP